MAGTGAAPVSRDVELRMEILFWLFVLMVASALLSLALNVIIRSRLLAVVAGVAVVDVLVVVWECSGVSKSPDAPEIAGLPMLLGVLLAPILLLTSYFLIGLLKRSAQPVASPNGGPASPGGNSGDAEGPPSVS